MSLRKDGSFRKLLVANRGEIAVRIIRTCRELGLPTVAVYSDADADAMHVRMADAAVRLGPAAATESYLRGDRIIEAALAEGVDAIHPGYGFLSEQAAFAAAVEAAGITFVGPTPEALAALGDKLAARRSAAAIGVPTVPGMFEPLAPDAVGASARIDELAAGIGYPLLIKAAAGGGGRGMRRVDAPGDLVAAIEAAARESAQAFGDGAVYLERLIEGGRHVEVQLIGDVAGRVVALGERDCSTQRRHQKLVEEAPAPGLTREQRVELHGLAVRIAQSVGLRNAATAEFLLAPDGAFHFLEVNARLQVEHGVTELVTGLDLVREQIAAAAGLPLSAAVLAAAERAAEPDRHAIELRISAEDPARDFAPSPGRISRWREPGGPGVRNDSGVEAGSVVTGDYDPMLAKVLVEAPDRPLALARALRAAAELETGGLQTTLPFHLWLLAHDAFTAGDLRTDLVARDWDPAPLRAAAARPAAAAVVAATRPTEPLLLVVDDVADATFELGPADTAPADRHAVVHPLPASADDRAAGLRRFEVTIEGWVLTVRAEVARRAALRARAGGNGGRRASHRIESVRAQIPGRIVRLWVAEGDTVEAGQRLLAIEAMKMENEVRATHEGIIETIGVSVGGSVELGDELLRMR